MTIEDVDFLIIQFTKVTEFQKYDIPSEFAERVRYMTGDLTPFPGKFSYSRFPYFREIVDLFHPLNPVKEVVLMKASQIGATTAVLETLILYNIMSDPTSQMYVNVDVGLMKTSVNVKIEKMIDNAGARDLIFSQNRKSKGAKDSGDTANAKEYPGGFLHFYGSKSSKGFRDKSYMRAYLDELDAYPVKIKDEGDVVLLARNRTNAYRSKRKIYYGGSPLVKQTSKIEPLFLQGDQNKYMVPCKHCGEFQELVWHGITESGETFGIVWQNDENFNPITGNPKKNIESTVGYKCRYCGGIMKNYDKEVIIPKGKWVPTEESKNPELKSYHLSVLYNPPGMASWEDMVLEWAQCWDIKNNRIKDKEKYRTFRNTWQGLTFEESGTQIYYEKAVLFRRAGFVRKKVPNDLSIEFNGGPILLVVASVDVQKHCLFVDVKGYAANGVSWTLDFFSLDGDTEDFNGPWDELDNFIENTRYAGTDGKIYTIAMTLIDSGWNTDYVYAFAGRHSFGVYACKGVAYIKAGETYKLFDKGTLDRIGLAQAYHINTTKMKDRISNAFQNAMWVSGQAQPLWYPNFPDDFRDDYFKMFEAENRVDQYDRVTNRYIRTIWKQKQGADNHAFDTFAYNLAALEIFADTWCRQVLGLPGLDLEAFWNSAAEGHFYETLPAAGNV
jgi:phage terminase large subunit GpA-like protein